MAMVVVMEVEMGFLMMRSCCSSIVSCSPFRAEMTQGSFRKPLLSGPKVHCSLGKVSQCLRYVVRCIERVMVPQTFTSVHDFHILNDDMIINKPRPETKATEAYFIYSYIPASAKN